MSDRLPTAAPRIPSTGPRSARGAGPAGRGRPRTAALAILRDRRGIIVLGPLIAFVVLLVVMVLAGKILYPEPRGTYVTRPAPELSYVVSPAEVYSGNRLAMTLRPGEPVWVVRLDNGSAVVFRDRTGREVVGITSAFLASPPAVGSPGPDVTSRPRSDRDALR